MFYGLIVSKTRADDGYFAVVVVFENDLTASPRAPWRAPLSILRARIHFVMFLRPCESDISNLIHIDGFMFRDAGFDM